MIDDKRIIELFFDRSERALAELDLKYGKPANMCQAPKWKKPKKFMDGQKGYNKSSRLTYVLQTG